MKNSSIYYSVGALLYCPANNENIFPSIAAEKFGKQYSLALCLEDNIHDGHVEEAERTMIQSISKIYDASLSREFYIPKIFIRVRSAGQIPRIFHSLGSSAALLC